MKIEKCVPVKRRKSQQLVASTDTPNLGMKDRRKRRTDKFNLENVPLNGNNHNKHSPRTRQTVLSEYFTSPNKSPKATPMCKSEKDEPVQLINVPLLLSQLLRAQVVLSRIPAARPTNAAPPSTIKAEPSDVATAGIAIVPTDGRVVQRYCHKCKILETDSSSITVRKICGKCGTLLIYVCTKCNSSHFAENRHLRKHIYKCTGDGSGQPNRDALASIVLRYCADCSFKSSHEVTLRKHIKHTGHKELNGEKVIEAVRMRERDAELKNTQREFIVKRDNESCKKGIRRYCKQCKKTVPGKRITKDLACKVCCTRLIYRCGKCNYKCNYYKTMYYHVKAKCYPNIYQCPKCHYTAPFWHQMRTHLCTQKYSDNVQK